ncbi:MAG TPA: SRPBCC family protein [Pirellulales bacterium]
MNIHIDEKPDGRGFLLRAEQLLPAPREEVFALFSAARELQELTPPWLHFAVLTPEPITIAAGVEIDYRLRLRGVPLRWRSRISAWEPPLRFVDEQVRGPYRYWRHEHTFEALPEGTLCRDLVEYAVLGGRVVHRLLVRNDLLRVFAFRQQRLAERFGLRT